MVADQFNVLGDCRVPASEHEDIKCGVTGEYIFHPVPHHMESEADVLDPVIVRGERDLTLQIRYEMEFFNFSLLSELQKDVMLVGEAEKTVETEDFTGPEMVKRLVEILMLNREQDKDVIRKVKSALLEWEV